MIPSQNDGEVAYKVMDNLCTILISLKYANILQYMTECFLLTVFF